MGQGHPSGEYQTLAHPNRSSTSDSNANPSMTGSGSPRPRQVAMGRSQSPQYISKRTLQYRNRQGSSVPWQLNRFAILSSITRGAIAVNVVRPNGLGLSLVAAVARLHGA